MATSSTSGINVERLTQQLLTSKPFNLISQSDCSQWLSTGKLVSLDPGQTLIARNQIQNRVYLVVSGTIRLLWEDEGKINTIGKRNVGQLVGWTNLLRASPCEWVSASSRTVVLALPADKFVSFVIKYPKFQEWFSSLPNSQENIHVALEGSKLMPQKFANWKNKLRDIAEDAIVISAVPGTTFTPPIFDDSDSYTWHISTDSIPDLPIGTPIKDGTLLPKNENFNLKYRIVGFKSLNIVGTLPEHANLNQSKVESLESLSSASLSSLGIVESDSQTNKDIYPIVKGYGLLNEILAVCEMLALFSNVPFRRDTLKKVIEGQFRRDKSLSIQLMGGLSEILGFISQLGEVDARNFENVEAPALFLLDQTPVILFKITPDQAVIGHPQTGLLEMPTNLLKEKLDDSMIIAIPRKVQETPSTRFGWSWFTPLIKKYKRSLILVFVASLLAQLFGLAIPLLIQQIIDKVLTQGNLSSLNIIGSLMITLAVFQGCLLALRQYIFVDTTDRMDLTLGSAVINRLLALPLSFFEKRPVGELSQRLGELNSIRGFLTGTALVSILNLIFAALYLIVMIMYSLF